MYRARNRSTLDRPASPDGNLYYVRLKTPVGTMYKLGFTKLSSVRERLAYQKSGDEQHIDKVLLFAHRPDAFTIEEQLHGYFGKKRLFGKYAAQKDRPLAGNGQSELYANDILGFDPEFSKAQEKTTKKMSKRAYSGDIVEDVLMGGIGVFLMSVFLPLIVLFDFTFGRENHRKDKARSKIEKTDIETVIKELKDHPIPSDADRPAPPAVKSAVSGPKSVPLKQAPVATLWTCTSMSCRMKAKSEVEEGNLSQVHMERVLMAMKAHNWQDFAKLCDADFLAREIVFSLSGLREGQNYVDFADNLGFRKFSLTIVGNQYSKVLRSRLFSPIAQAYRRFMEQRIKDRGQETIKAEWPDEPLFELGNAYVDDGEVGHFFEPALATEVLGVVCQSVRKIGYNKGLLDFGFRVVNQRTGFDEEILCRADMRGIELCDSPVKIRPLNLKAVLDIAYKKAAPG